MKLPENWQDQGHDAGHGRTWRWSPFADDDGTVWALFAQAYDADGEEYTDECWQMDELLEAGGPLTEAALAQAAMSFEAAYGGPEV